MASSSIRQPEDVFVSVASPVAPGARPVGARARLEALAGGARAERRPPRSRRPARRSQRRRSGRGGAAPARGARAAAPRCAPAGPPAPRPRPRRSARARPPAAARRAGRRAPATPRLVPRARHGAPAPATRPRAPPARRSPDRRFVFSTTSHRHGNTKGKLGRRSAPSRLEGAPQANPGERRRRSHALNDPASADAIPAAAPDHRLAGSRE